MRTKTQIASAIEECGIVAIVRLNSSDELRRVADAIQSGGVNVIEFTMTTPGALKIIEECAASLGGSGLIGAGTVLDPETARLAILAGAEFIVSPNLNPAVIRTCDRYGKVCVPGALTPTEIASAIERGADFVKLFPAFVFGPPYVKALRAPLPQARLVPTGGVTVENAADYFKAGAAALAVGSELVNPAVVTRGDFGAIRENARRFREAAIQARNP